MTKTLKVVTTFPNGSRMVRFYPGLDMTDGLIQLGEPSFYTWSPCQEPLEPHQSTDEKQETE